MMVDVRTIYDAKDCRWYDYQPMLNAFGKIAVQIDDNEYQGDTRVLYDNDGKIGHLIFGWGSCSGCDALQACRNIDDVQRLCNELQGEIRWFDTEQDALSWFISHDWEGDYCGRDKNTKRYVERCVAYLQRHNRIRAAIIKEFAERLHARVRDVGVHSAIDCVAKEMGVDV